MGITHQALNSNLSSDDVKSSLIERMSATSGIPISEIYGEAPRTSANASGTGNTAIAGNGNSLNIKNEERYLSLLEEKDRQIAKLLDIISKK